MSYAVSSGSTRISSSVVYDISDDDDGRKSINKKDVDLYCSSNNSENSDDQKKPPAKESINENARRDESSSSSESSDESCDDSCIPYYTIYTITALRQIDAKASIKIQLLFTKKYIYSNPF